MSRKTNLVEEPGSQGLGFSFVGMVIRWGFGEECRKREG